MMYDSEAMAERWPEELTPDPHYRGFYICPFCGSGTGPKGTGAFSFRDKKHGHCFSCGFDGDIFDGELKTMGIEPSHATKEQKAEAFRRVATRYDFLPSKGSPKPAAAAAPVVPPPVADFSDYCGRCAHQLPGSPGEKYLLGRGFSEETMGRFRLGYDPGHYFPGRGTFPAIVFPYDLTGHYCGWRAITEKHFDKPKTSEAGPEPVFNVDALYSGEPVFVVESQLDAITLEQEGFRAVAIGGGGVNKLKSQVDKRAPAGPLVLCFDMDESGKGDTAKAAEILEERDLFFIDGAAALMGDGCKDPNEVLQKKGSEEFRRAAGAASDDALFRLAMKMQADNEERERRTGPGMIDSFLQDIQTRMYEPLPTGIQDIDKALDGGFMRQQLICLGAAPGAGKTALAQWIFEGMAAKGVPCIFLNLEMSRNQILARSISRIAATNGHKISNVKALRGYGWTDEERAAVLEAAEEYKRTIAPRMIYNPDEVTSNLDSILKYIKEEAARAKAKGVPVPCVVLDYLQIVTGNDREDGVELIKRAVFNLKRFAVENNTVVFLIMAHNRDSNKSGNVTMESGRDTSAIEYSGDTQIGLTFTRCLKGWTDENGIKHDKGKSPDDLTEQERREITLKIVKSRFGGAGRTVDLRFNGETMTYTQTYKEFTKVEVETPFDDDREWEIVTK